MLELIFSKLIQNFTRKIYHFYRLCQSTRILIHSVWKFSKEYAGQIRFRKLALVFDNEVVFILLQKYTPLKVYRFILNQHIGELKTSIRVWVDEEPRIPRLTMCFILLLQYLSSTSRNYQNWISRVHSSKNLKPKMYTTGSS